MRKAPSLILSLATLLALQTNAFADVTAIKTDHASLDLGGMGQLLGFGQLVNDPYKNSDRLYLFMKEARLRASGRYDDYSFNLELAMGGEDSVAAPNPGVTLGLLDLSLNIPVHALGASYVKVGQFKVPYGRERLTYSGNSQFVDRSIQDVGFKVGRDVGAALTLRPGMATIIAGVFTGGGRDVPPQHYLPEKVGVPLLVVRAGVGDLDEDPYALKQTRLDLQKAKYAFFVNGLYTQDSLVGHSSVLNVKLADKSLLLNGNWNPYIGQSPLAQGQFWQAGADAALGMPIGANALSAEAEFNYGGFTNSYGSLHMVGGRAQAAFLFSSTFEVALRYAFLLPSGQFAAGGVPITGTQAMQELTPALTWYIRGNSLKLVADLPVLINAPVIVEKNVGAYVASELPDETTVLAKGGSVVRQNVVEGRLMLQAWF